MVKTKSQKVLGDNSYVCRSYRGKVSKGGLFAPILNRVNIIYAHKRHGKSATKFHVIDRNNS